LLSEIPIHQITKSNVIFIDEAQFFDDLYECVYSLVELYGKHVVVAGLDGDCNRKKFGSILDLIPICNTIDKYSAYCSVCKDGTLAPFTKKAFNYVCENKIEIGGSDKYMPVCRNHFDTVGA
jgi:thymidine kinase